MSRNQALCGRILQIHYCLSDDAQVTVYKTEVTRGWEGRKTEVPRAEKTSQRQGQ